MSSPETALTDHIETVHRAMRPDPFFDPWLYGSTSGCVECNKLAANVKSAPKPSKGSGRASESFFVLMNVRKRSKKPWSEKEKAQVVMRMRQSIGQGLIAAGLGDLLSGAVEEYSGSFYQGGLSLSLDFEIRNPTGTRPDLEKKVKQVLAEAILQDEFQLRAEIFDSKQVQRLSTE